MMDKAYEQYDQLLKERNEMTLEIGRLPRAAGVLANIYDACLEQKSKAWCKHWECIPLNQIHEVQFKMPTIADCLQAKLACENEPESK